MKETIAKQNHTEQSNNVTVHFGIHKKIREMEQTPMHIFNRVCSITS